VTNEKVREATALPKLENIISYRRLRWLGHLSHMDHQFIIGSRDQLSNGNPRVSGRGQVDRDRTGTESSTRSLGKWASAGTRLKRLRKTGAGGIVSLNASLTRAEPGTRTTTGSTAGITARCQKMKKTFWKTTVKTKQAAVTQ